MAALTVAILLFALVGVLVAGLVLMGMGGKANEKYGNKLMSARVWLQAIILILLALMFVGVK
jgi:hypothetical protein